MVGLPEMLDVVETKLLKHIDGLKNSLYVGDGGHGLVWADFVYGQCGKEFTILENIAVGMEKEFVKIHMQ